MRNMTQEHRNPRQKRYLVWYVPQGSHNIVVSLHMSTLLKQLPCFRSHFPSDSKFQSFSSESNPLYGQKTFCSPKVLHILVRILWMEDIGVYVVVSFLYQMSQFFFCFSVWWCMLMKFKQKKKKEKLPATFRKFEI